ncbi:hypothetical protein HYH02_000425 [Chlamydomonas schloesseri]|uniref:Uncharacterized protein n=1 Tax=Chlamydomonas schloesseri TaxID=2026947 RepID=A0A836BCU5_9CHLO|nr:hypothetical protein HYH02_000425 [Chlamydomonas schloesseri]|eukprot:KAG2454583.1 hypothetical protein HYH02_000425 [Chlamydomonas schloesseri]
MTRRSRLARARDCRRPHQGLLVALSVHRPGGRGLLRGAAVIARWRPEDAEASEGKGDADAAARAAAAASPLTAEQVEEEDRGQIIAVCEQFVDAWWRGVARGVDTATDTFSQLLVGAPQPPSPPPPAVAAPPAPPPADTAAAQGGAAGSPESGASSSATAGGSDASAPAATAPPPHKHHEHDRHLHLGWRRAHREPKRSVAQAPPPQQQPLDSLPEARQAPTQATSDGPGSSSSSSGSSSGGTGTGGARAGSKVADAGAAPAAAAAGEADQEFLLLPDGVLHRRPLRGYGTLLTQLAAQHAEYHRVQYRPVASAANPGSGVGYVLGEFRMQDVGGLAGHPATFRISKGNCLYKFQVVEERAGAEGGPALEAGRGGASATAAAGAAATGSGSGRRRHVISRGWVRRQMTQEERDDRVWDPVHVYPAPFPIERLHLTRGGRPDAAAMEEAACAWVAAQAKPRRRTVAQPTIPPIATGGGGSAGEGPAAQPQLEEVGGLQRQRAVEEGSGGASAGHVTSISTLRQITSTDPHRAGQLPDTAASSSSSSRSTSSSGASSSSSTAMLGSCGGRSGMLHDAYGIYPGPEDLRLLSGAGGAGGYGSSRSQQPVLGPEAILQRIQAQQRLTEHVEPLLHDVAVSADHNIAFVHWVNIITPAAAAAAATTAEPEPAATAAAARATSGGGSRAGMQSPLRGGTAAVAARAVPRQQVQSGEAVGKPQAPAAEGCGLSREAGVGEVEQAPSDVGVPAGGTSEAGAGDAASAAAPLAGPASSSDAGLGLQVSGSGTTPGGMLTSGSGRSSAASIAAVSNVATAAANAATAAAQAATAAAGVATTAASAANVAATTANTAATMAATAATAAAFMAAAEQADPPVITSSAAADGAAGEATPASLGQTGAGAMARGGTRAALSPASAAGAPRGPASPLENQQEPSGGATGGGSGGNSGGDGGPLSSLDLRLQERLQDLRLAMPQVQMQMPAQIQGLEEVITAAAQRVAGAAGTAAAAASAAAAAATAVIMAEQAAQQQAAAGGGKAAGGGAAERAGAATAVAPLPPPPPPVPYHQENMAALLFDDDGAVTDVWLLRSPFHWERRLLRP